jgi:hypothetical protein
MPEYKVTWRGEMSGTVTSILYAANEQNAREKVKNRYYCSIVDVEEIKKEKKEIKCPHCGKTFRP